jgi:hypothetical protein
MNNKIHGVGDIAGYTLSKESYDELLDIRDMLFAMAKITYILTADDEDSTFLSVRRPQLGEIFEHIGSEIDAVMATVKPTAKVVEVPSHVH